MRKELLILSIGLAGIILLSLLVGDTIGKAIRIVMETPVGGEAQHPLSTTGTTHVYGKGLIASKSGSSIRYQFQDPLSSNRLATDDRGLLQSRYIAYPYGKTLQKQSYAESSQRYTFTGKEEDGNLLYFGARYFDSRIGRFSSADPIQRFGSHYEYGLANPLQVNDPSGKDPNILTPAEPDVLNTQTQTIQILPLQPELASLSPEPDAPSYADFAEDFPSEKGYYYYYRGSGRNIYPHVRRGYGEVLNLPLICIEEQCADVNLHLNAIWQREYTGDAVLPFKGQPLRYSTWHENENSKRFGSDWEGYLRYIFAFTGSSDLKRDLPSVVLTDLQPGDLLIQRGGHTMGVRSIKRDEGGKMVSVSIFEGNTPAQDVKVRSHDFTRKELESMITSNKIVLRRFLITTVDEP